MTRRRRALTTAALVTGGALFLASCSADEPPSDEPPSDASVDSFCSAFEAWDATMEGVEAGPVIETGKEVAEVGTPAGTPQPERDGFLAVAEWVGADDPQAADAPWREEQDADTRRTHYRFAQWALATCMTGEVAESGATMQDVLSGQGS